MSTFEDDRLNLLNIFYHYGGFLCSFYELLGLLRQSLIPLSYCTLGIFFVTTICSIK